MDKNDQLRSRPFTFTITKDDTLIVYRDNRQVKVIGGKKAMRFIIDHRSMDEMAIQQTLARLTGHYK